MKKMCLLISLLLSGCVGQPDFSQSDIIWKTPVEDGRLLYGAVSDKTEIYIQNSDKEEKKQGLFQIPTHQGKFVLGVPQDAEKLTLVLKTKNQEKKVEVKITPRKWQEEYVSGLPPKKVVPPKEEQDRIQTEFAQMRAKRQVSEYPKFPEKWQMPISDYKRISSFFGSRRIMNGVVKQGHSGTDYAANMGTSVVASADGKVVFVHPDMFYSGATILIDHGYGVYTSYAHLSEISVKEGQKVQAGDEIGKVGMSGRATGPHLHFGLSWYDVRLNPEDLFK